MLLRDLEQWKANLPEELQFQGQDTGRHGGEWSPAFQLSAA